MQTPISSPTNSREIPSGSESWYSDCLSLRTDSGCSAAACAFVYRGAELRASLPRARLSGWEDRLPLTCCFALSGVVRSRTSQLPGALAPSLRGTGGGTLRYRRACRKEPMCLRTGVPLRCLSVSPSRRSHFSSRTEPLGKRHWAAPL